MLQGERIGIPIQFELAGQGHTVLADDDPESGRPNRAGERPAESVAQGGGRRRNDEAQRRRRRLGLRAVTQEKDGAASLLRTSMQAARRREIEQAWIAAQFDEDGRQAGQTRALLGDPQRVGQLWCLRQEKRLGCDAETLQHARRIGQASLVKHVSRADPQQRRLAFRLAKKLARQRENEACRGPRIAHFDGVDFRQRRPWQTAAEHLVEGSYPGRHDVGGPGNAVASDDQPMAMGGISSIISTDIRRT